jgi:ribosome-associated toxin RatA of RatAB toxin-antitoxin module
VVADGGSEVAEETKGYIEIKASPEEILEVITDFDAYPKWAQGVKDAKVKKKDSKGRPSEVFMEAGSMGIGAKYTLKYTYKAKNGGLSWTSTEASGAVKSIRGEYVLEPEDEKKTKVTYRTTMELAISIPGFMRRQGEKMIIDTALKGLKKRVEGR